MLLSEIVSIERCIMCYHMVYEIQVKSPNVKKSVFLKSKFRLEFRNENQKRLERLKIGQYAIMQNNKNIKKEKMANAEMFRTKKFGAVQCQGYHVCAWQL